MIGVALLSLAGCDAVQQAFNVKPEEFAACVAQIKKVRGIELPPVGETRGIQINNGIRTVSISWPAEGERPEFICNLRSGTITALAGVRALPVK